MTITQTQSRSSKWYLANKDKQIERQRQARLARPPAEQKALTRKYHLKAKYGITPEQFDQVFQFQNSLCAICKSDDPKHFRGWNLDHCHATGEVRGVLCHHCNLLLGNARDSTEIIGAAISYLKNPPANAVIP